MNIHPACPEDKIIFDSSIDAIICSTDKGKITRLNPSAKKMFGYTSEEALDKQITMLIPHDNNIGSL